jgi:branched-chain amino acid aminotransferase
MATKVWLDGQMIDTADAKLHVYDHAALYGDGVFEGIRVYSGRVFECKAHLDRLYASARAIRLDIPYTAAQLEAAMYQTVKANGYTDCYIRLVVTRGAGDLGLSPRKCPRPTVFCIADTIELYPREMYEKGMAIITASITRSHPNSVPPRVKSLNYLNNILAKIEAIDAGVPEALMLNHEGNVAECTGDNIFIVRADQVQTATTSDGILEGITRAVILRLCGKLGISCVEKTLQRYDVYTADECFLTGTAAEVVAVTKIDGRSIGNGQVGPITRRLTDAFQKRIREG